MTKTIALAIAAVLLATAPAAMARSREAKVVNVQFYRSISGHNEAVVYIKNIGRQRYARLYVNKICATATNGQRVCGLGAEKIKVEETRGVRIDFGTTDYPLKRVYIKE